MKLPLFAPKSTLVQNGLVMNYDFRQKNLLKYSEDFTNSVWSKSTGLSFINGYDDPFGGKNAWLLDDQSTTASLEVTQLITVPNDGLARVFSVYVKQGTAEQTGVSVKYTGGTSVSVNPAITWATNTISGTVAKMTPVGNGWYRVQIPIVNNTSGNTVLQPEIYVSKWLADGSTTGSVYVAFPQVELGPVATSYEKTMINQTLWNRKLDSYSVANLITNGNFANGLTGWTATNATAAVTDGVCTVTGNGVASSVSLVRTNAGVLDVTHKYYTRLKVKVKNAVGPTIRIDYDGSINGTNKTVTSVTSSIENNLYTLSALDTPPADATGTFKAIFTHGYADTATANGKQAEVTEFFCVDMTALFGAGNEPATAAQCDMLFPIWFDGTRVMQLPKYNGILGSTTASDTNDGYWNGQGLVMSTDDYINCYVTSLLASNTNGLTVMAVAYRGVDTSSGVLVGQYNGGANKREWALGFKSFQVQEDPALYDANTMTTNTGKSGTHVSTGLWKPGGKAQQIYNNFATTSESVSSVADMGDAGAVLEIGRYSIGTTYMNGTMYGVLIYNRALSKAEILQNYRYLKKQMAERGVQVA